MASLAAPFCLYCYRAHGIKNLLEENFDTRELACPECFMVDAAQSNARNIVQDSDTGAVLDETERYRTLQQEWKNNRSSQEKRFKEKLVNLLNTYLIEPKTCILGKPDPQLKPHALNIYNQIRRAETDKRLRAAAERATQKLKYTGSVNVEARRLNYQVVVAIKLAAQLRVIGWINDKLHREKTWDKNIPKTIPGTTPTVPPLWELYGATLKISNPEFGQLEDFSYLTHIHRVSCQLIQCPISVTDEVLCSFLQAIKRLKELASYSSFEERLPHLASTPTNGESKGSKTREWRVSDWAYFDSFTPDWEKILEIGFNLFRAQQCVRIWERVETPACGIALCVIAVQAQVGQIIPYHVNVTRELALDFGMTELVAMERQRELRRLIIAWSTSLIDLKMPYPQLNPPRVGGLGDGIKGYASDTRRAIPDTEIFVAAARVVAENWQKILIARLKGRKKVFLFEVELANARLQAAHAGMKLNARQMLDGYLNRQHAVRANVNRNMAASGGQPQLFASTLLSATNTTPAPSLPRATAPAPDPILDMLNIPDSPGVEDLIGLPEQTSDGEVDSSDEEDDQASRRRTLAPLRGQSSKNLTGLDLDGLNSSDIEPFAFTIGPEGFSRAKPDSHDTIIKQIPIPLASSNPQPGFASTSALSSVTMVKAQSSTTIASDRGVGSASETERALLGSTSPKKQAAIADKMASGSIQIKQSSSVPSATSTAMSRENSATSATTHASSSRSKPNIARSTISASPAISVTPLRELEIYEQRTSANGSSHIGLLEREREQYVAERYNTRVKKAKMEEKARSLASESASVASEVGSQFGDSSTSKKRAASSVEAVARQARKAKVAPGAVTSVMTPPAPPPYIQFSQ